MKDLLSRAVILWLIAMYALFVAENIATAEKKKPEVERLLVQFQNDYLPGVGNYSEEIKYPKTDDYYFAWASLVIAVGEDTAIILTAGHSEAIVKLVDAGVAGEKIVRGKAAEVAVDYAVGEAVDYGLKKAVGTSVPGFRSGVAVFGVLKAGEKDRQRVFQSIREQKEIQRFIGDIAPSIVKLQTKINTVESPAKRVEYQQMLAAMLQKKAELTVYRQITKDKFKSNAGLSLDKAIDNAIPGRKIHDAYTANISFANIVNKYIDGSLSEKDFDSYLHVEVKNRIGSLSRANVDFVLRDVKTELSDIAVRRQEVNKYESYKSITKQRASNYQALDRLIPRGYRMVAALDIKDLSRKIPESFKNTAPNQGTVVSRFSKSKKGNSSPDVDRQSERLKKTKEQLISNWRELTWRAIVPNWTNNIHSWNKSGRYNPYKGWFSGSCDSLWDVSKKIKASDFSGAPRLEKELVDEYVNNIQKGNIGGMVNSLGKIQNAKGWQYWSKKAGVNHQLNQVTGDFRNKYNQDMGTTQGREAIQMTGQMLRSIPWKN